MEDGLRYDLVFDSVTIGGERVEGGECELFISMNLYDRIVGVVN